MNKNTKPIKKHLTDFLNYCEIEKGLASKTQENYSRFLGDFFAWLKASGLESISPSELKADHVWKYRLYLSRNKSLRTKTELKKTSQNLYLIALRALLEYFSEKEINSLPPNKIKLAKISGDREINFLNIDQVEKLLSSPDTSKESGLRDRSILETFFSTGLRVSELVSLNRDQVKIDKKTEDLEIVIVGKGSKIRTVYLSKRAIFWLKKYLESRTDIDEALFINYWRPAAKEGKSRRLTVKSIDEIVKKYVKIAGLPLITTPHTLRHSFATDLLSQGVDLRLVQEFLGHQNIATTQIYTHVTKKQLRDIHRKIHSNRKK
jgi:site-specific recombinase XerD